MGAYADFRRDVERFKDWINAQAVAGINEPVEPGRYAVDEDEIDFGMRNAEAFNEIFRRRGCHKRLLKRVIFLVRRQVIVKLGVEPDAGVWPIKPHAFRLPL